MISIMIIITIIIIMVLNIIIIIIIIIITICIFTICNFVDNFIFAVLFKLKRINMHLDKNKNNKKPRRRLFEDAEVMEMGSLTSRIVPDGSTKIPKPSRSRSTEKVSRSVKDRHGRVPEHHEDMPKYSDFANSVFGNPSGASWTLGIIVY